MNQYLVDTDVLIDISKGNLDAANFLDGLPGEVVISRISAIELITGAWNKREQVVIEKFINRYQVKEL